MTTPDLHAQDRTTLLALRMRHNAALASGDVAGITGLCAADYVLIAGSGEILRGVGPYKKLIASQFRPGSPAMRFVRTPENFEIGEADGALRAAEIGTWTGTAPDGSGLRGRYMVHWTKESGDWRMLAENYVTLGAIAA